METHTRVVEFFGLPGCGKTTLTDYLIDNPNSAGTPIFGRINQLSEKYRRLSFINKIGVIPFKAWFYSSLFILSVPKIPVKEWKLYRSFFYITMMYKVSEKTSIPSFILVDHGLFQAAQSVIYSHSESLSNRSWRLLMKIASSINIDYAVYCVVSKEESLQRIRIRNRKGNGRLDMIEDDALLLSHLEQQTHLFDKVHNLMKRLSNSVILTLDMKEQVSEIADDLKTRLK